MCANLVVKVAVLFDLFKLLLFLFLGAGANCSGYSMLDGIPSVKLSVSWMRGVQESYTGHFDPPRTMRKVKRGLLLGSYVTAKCRNARNKMGGP